MLNQGVLAAIPFIVVGAMFLLLADAITRELQRTVKTIGGIFPASMYKPVFVRLVGGIAIFVGAVSLLIFW